MHVESTRVARFRALELSPAAFVRFAVASLAALWIIVATGAAVRLTDSGLGCRSWPGCEKGNFLPEKDYHGFIEFGNRAVGGITILLTLAAALAALRTRGLPRWAVRLAVAVFGGTLLQAPIGLLAVATDLRWPIVMAHLLLSIALLGGAVVLVLQAYALRDGHGPPAPPELRTAGLVLAATCFVLVVSGAFATAAGPHSGGGDDIERFGQLEPLVYVHAGVVGLFAAAFVFALGYLAAQRRALPRVFYAALAVAGVLALQIGAGEIQYWTELPWWLVLIHVALASVVWSGVVALATLFFRPPAWFAARGA